MSARARVHLSQRVHDWLDQADLVDVVHVQQALFRLLDNPDLVPVGRSTTGAGPWTVVLFLAADMPYIQVLDVV